MKMFIDTEKKEITFIGEGLTEFMRKSGGNCIMIDNSYKLLSAPATGLFTYETE